MAKILVVDDKPSNRRVLVAVLKAAGHDPFEAENGAAALNLAQARQPDLVITDIMMPVMDGFEFAKRLRGDAAIAGTPIIFYTTTFRGPEARAMATLCGVHTVLPKPCPAKTLIAAVNKELGIPMPVSDDALPALEETWESASRLRLRFDWYRQELGELKVLSQKLFAQLHPSAAEAQSVQTAQERFTNTFTRLRQFSGGITQLIETTLHAVPERGPLHIAESFFKTASRIIDCTYVVLSIVETPAGTTRRVFATGLPAELYDSAAAHRAPLLAFLSEENSGHSVRRDARAGAIEGLPPDHPEITAFLGVPICSRDWYYGWVYFADTREGRVFTDEEDCIAASLAAELAAFYENAHMYDLMQRHSSELRVEIVRREQAEERNRQTERQLAQLQKMESIGQLTGGIAHDFNNLLTVITANAEDLRDGITSPLHARQIGLILNAASRGATLIRQLLAFARKQDLRPEVIDVPNLLDATAVLLQRTLAKNIDVTISKRVEKVHVSVDPASLQSALLNLAFNARDAMPDGGKITMSLDIAELGAQYDGHAATPGRYVHLKVADTGMGMPPEVIAKAFEPFFTTKEVGKGTGLGLSMVYGFAKQSGGHVTIESAPNRGTTVHLHLPLVEMQSLQTTEAAKAIQGSPRECAILLVEDDELVRESVEAKIGRLGYRVTAVGSAHDALATLEKNACYDLLFTDVIMPGAMTGVDLACEVMKRWPAIKVLATSGYTENNLLGKVRIPAGIALLPKPYSTTALAEALASAVGMA